MTPRKQYLLDTARQLHICTHSSWYRMHRPVQDPTRLNSSIERGRECKVIYMQRLMSIVLKWARFETISKLEYQGSELVS